MASRTESPTHSLPSNVLVEIGAVSPLEIEEAIAAIRGEGGRHQSHHSTLWERLRSHILGSASCGFPPPPTSVPSTSTGREGLGGDSSGVALTTMRVSSWLGRSSIL